MVLLDQIMPDFVINRKAPIIMGVEVLDTAMRAVGGKPPKIVDWEAMLNAHPFDDVRIDSEGVSGTVSVYALVKYNRHAIIVRENILYPHLCEQAVVTL